MFTLHKMVFYDLLSKRLSFVLVVRNQLRKSHQNYKTYSRESTSLYDSLNEVRVGG